MKPLSTPWSGLVLLVYILSHVKRDRIFIKIIKIVKNLSVFFVKFCSALTTLCKDII